MIFYDKNETILRTGDRIVPDKGRELVITSIEYVDDFEEECMIGQQIVNPLLFSVLTQDNLSKQWTKVE